MYHPRALRAAWLKASRQFPALLLTGARQVGKTTFLRHLCEKSRSYVTLDDLRLRELACSDPPLFLQRYGTPLLIDEIQYAPELLPYIKMAIDADRAPGRYWLTGSQQFSTMQGVSETLAGRVAILNMLGFSRRERLRLAPRRKGFLPGRTNSLPKSDSGESLRETYKAIWRGGFPELVAPAAPPGRDLFFSSYLQTYLQRDIRDLAQVGDEMAFTRFIRASAARTGQLLNLADLARDADVSIPTAKRWLSVLEASFQVFLLPPWHSNVTKRFVKTPKLYFLDTGLAAYLTEWTDPATLEAGAMSGAVFETYVLGEILKGYWSLGQKPPLYFYRDRDGREIDFLFHVNDTLYPVEVKKSASPRPEHTQSFKALDRLKKPVGHGAVVCLIDRPLPLDRQTEALPVEVL